MTSMYQFPLYFAAKIYNFTEPIVPENLIHLSLQSQVYGIWLIMHPIVSFPLYLS